MHADFVRVVAGQKLTAIVPVHFINEEAPVKKGGEISHVVAEIEVSCLPKTCLSSSKSTWQRRSRHHHPPVGPQSS
jgi:hypothetical protein